MKGLDLFDVARELWYEFRLLVVSWLLGLMVLVAPKERHGIAVAQGVLFIATELQKE